MRFSKYLNETLMRSNRGIPYDELRYEQAAKDLMIDAYGDVDPETLKDKYKKQWAKKQNLDPDLFVKIYNKMIRNGEWPKIRREEFRE